MKSFATSTARRKELSTTNLFPAFVKESTRSLADVTSFMFGWIPFLPPFVTSANYTRHHLQIHIIAHQQLISLNNYATEKNQIHRIQSLSKHPNVEVPSQDIYQITYSRSDIKDFKNSFHIIDIHKSYMFRGCRRWVPEQSQALESLFSFQASRAHLHRQRFSGRKNHRI